ncbi:HNH endonuclease [bacterium]|nr:HNH endonuclease [bacterium]
MSAADIHARLEAALRELQRAEKNAVLLFGEILQRKLYRDLGYSSIQVYAAEALGFSPSKTSQFVRLAGALEELPRLRRSVASGKLGWTKAREVAKVATPASEERWIAEAERSSSRKLEQTVRATRKQARQAPQAAELPALDLGESASDSLPTDAPITVITKLTAEQYARYEALLETIRKRGGRKDSTVRGMDRAELLLAALNDLAEKLDHSTKTEAVSSPPYQVIVYTCKACGKSEVQTDRGPKPISTELVQCDAVIQEPGKPNRSTIPPKARQTAMVRANHRCETPGCGRTRFLEVHHKCPRSQGGGNEADNLQVLCSSCHQLVHQQERSRSVLTGPAMAPPPHQPQPYRPRRRPAHAR